MQIQNSYGCSGPFKEQFIYASLVSKQGISVAISVEYSTFLPTKVNK